MKVVLKALVAELKDHPSIDLEDGFVGEGLRDDEIDTIIGEQGLQLAPALRSFYREVNGVSIAWRVSAKGRQKLKFIGDAEDDPVYGVVSLTLLEDLVISSSALKGPVWEEAMSKQGRRQLTNFRTFDTNVEEARVGFMCARAKVNDALYYVRQGNRSVFNMESNLDRYLRALRQSRGFYWWQDEFALRPAGLKTSAMFHYVSQLFPGEKFSEFKK